MSSLDHVTFDTEGYDPQGDEDNVRAWLAPTGDVVGLYYYAKPPDIEADLDDLEGLRRSYRAAIEQSGLGVVEIERLAVDGRPAVRTLVKAPQEPTGRTYLGSITVPFRDFSYVLKVQCEEAHPTGVRDEVVLDRLLGNGTVRFDAAKKAGEGRGGVVGWLSDPYDPAAEGPMTRNRSEAEAYDGEFPDHPVSRARAILRHLEATIRVSDELRDAPPFAFVGGPSKKRRWWKLW